MYILRLDDISNKAPANEYATYARNGCGEIYITRIYNFSSEYKNYMYANTFFFKVEEKFDIISINNVSNHR